MHGLGKGQRAVLATCMRAVQAARTSDVLGVTAPRPASRSSRRLKMSPSASSGASLGASKSGLSGYHDTGCALSGQEGVVAVEKADRSGSGSICVRQHAPHVMWLMHQRVTACLSATDRLQRVLCRLLSEPMFPRDLLPTETGDKASDRPEHRPDARACTWNTEGSTVLRYSFSSRENSVSDSIPSGESMGTHVACRW
jgi:hypothetical protein